jgi:hypothetical protein
MLRSNQAGDELRALRLNRAAPSCPVKGRRTVPPRKATSVIIGYYDGTVMISLPTLSATRAAGECFHTTLPGQGSVLLTRYLILLTGAVIA